MEGDQEQEEEGDGDGAEHSARIKQSMCKWTSKGENE